MKNTLVALLLFLCGVVMGATTSDVKLVVAYDTPFSYVRITELSGDYNPWQNGIYVGYSSMEGSVVLSNQEIPFSPNSRFSGNVEILDLETRQNSFFVVELLAQTGSLPGDDIYIAYSDVVDYNLLSNAVVSGQAKPWTISNIGGRNSAHAVPEPTSGLLLLMGGALLGLRRKRRVA